MVLPIAGWNLETREFAFGIDLSWDQAFSMTKIIPLSMSRYQTVIIR